jgi:hypothetical protein
LREYGETNSFISLIFLDIYRGSVQKIHTIEYQGDNIQIVVNQTDPTTFLLIHHIEDERALRICKIVNNAIIIENMIETDFVPKCFYGNYVYSFGWYEEYLKVKYYKCLINALNILET